MKDSAPSRRRWVVALGVLAALAATAVFTLIELPISAPRLQPEEEGFELLDGTFSLPLTATKESGAPAGVSAVARGLVRDLDRARERGASDDRYLWAVTDRNSRLSVDRDNDGVPNASDNCVGTANADQKDRDGDGAGNACDLVDGITGPK